MKHSSNECPLGLPGIACPDDDGDGIANYLESNTDSDGDGIPNYLDLNSDGDSICDLHESGITNSMALDMDTNCVIDPTNTFGANGLIDALETFPDSGTITYTLQDSDGDGVPDAQENNDADLDGDGLTNNNDTDDDGDGIPTVQESKGDTDGDGVPQYLQNINPSILNLTENNQTIIWTFSTTNFNYYGWQYTTNLVESPWITGANRLLNIFGNSSITITDQNATATAPIKFYRVILE
ncbi:MAG: hypothetical protein GKR87_10370 [Kiritimatiellae bacterium]|nr:hypothetical protein [Kiritimatiellia bacterium]